MDTIPASECVYFTALVVVSVYEMLYPLMVSLPLWSGGCQVTLRV